MVLSGFGWVRVSSGGFGIILGGFAGGFGGFGWYRMDLGRFTF